MTLEYEERGGWPESPVATKEDAADVQTRTSSKSTTRSNRQTRILKQSPRIVFSSPSYYHRWMWVIIGIPLLLIFIQIIAILVASAKKEDFVSSQESWVLGWTLILIFGIYMMVLPKQVDVRSNGNIGIKTFLITYQFRGTVRAYEAGIGREDFMRPRLKFATCFHPPHRIVVRRRGGKWDLVVSPTDPEGFLQAVETVCAKLEQGEVGVGLKHGADVENVTSKPQQVAGEKPDLSTT